MGLAGVLSEKVKKTVKTQQTFSNSASLPSESSHITYIKINTFRHGAVAVIRTSFWKFVVRSCARMFDWSYLHAVAPFLNRNIPSVI